MTRPKPTLAWLLPIAATALALAVFLAEPLPLRVLRNTVFDQYQRWSPRVYQTVPVRIVDIDDASLARLGQWPWPRGHLAELTERLRAAGAAAIAFDVIFAEPDRTAPAAMLRSWRSNDPAHALTRADATPADLHRPYRTVDLGPSPRPYLHTFNGAIGALPDLQRAAAGNGAITFVPDSDGVVRRVPMLLRLGEEPVPSLVAEALRVGQGATNYLIKTAPEAGVGLESVRIGAVLIK
jgi:adenylate cyclase